MQVQGCSAQGLLTKSSGGKLWCREAVKRDMKTVYIYYRVQLPQDNSDTESPAMCTLYVESWVPILFVLLLIVLVPGMNYCIGSSDSVRSSMTIRQYRIESNLISR